jgi:hypothetical protein
MVRLRTLLLAAVSLAVSTIIVQGADLEGQPSIAWHRHPWRHWHEALVEGVRGASPLTVPFYASGWYPGPTYYYGWQRRAVVWPRP